MYVTEISYKNSYQSFIRLNVILRSRFACMHVCIYVMYMYVFTYVFDVSIHYCKYESTILNACMSTANYSSMVFV